MSRFWLAVVLVGATVLQPASGQGTLTQIGLTGENIALARRFAAVDALAEAGKWLEVVDEYLRILDEAGDDLVPLEPRRSVAARYLCHQRLAALPGDALEIYREHVDGPIRGAWQKAAATYDTRALRKIVNDAFCSRYADQALDMLGDLAFTRGDFDEAAAWWRMIARPLVADSTRQAPAKTKPGDELRYPDPTVNVAKVRAKQILAQIFQGEGNAASAALRLYRQKHGNGEGDLAGRHAKFADILADLLKPLHAIENPVRSSDWPTFAGDDSRQSIIPKGLDARLVDRPSFAIGFLEAIARRRTPMVKVQTASGLARTLVYYPVIAEGKVILATASRVLAYDIALGRIAGTYSLREDLPSGGVDLGFNAAPPGERFTASIADGRIYVRLARRLTPNGSSRLGPIEDSYLVCLKLAPESDGKLKRLWRVAARERAGDPPTVFEGSPLVHDGRVYVARARLNGSQVSTAIECYGAVSGVRHWHRDVSEIRESADGIVNHRHHLLTRAGARIVYASHSGAIVALDSLTGARQWAVRYPSRGGFTSQGNPSPRDLAPCICHAGSVYVAPADYDRILCLNAAMGQLRWESEPVATVHLLGVAGGKLILTTGRTSPGITAPSAPEGIRALDINIGASVRSWMQPADGVSRLPSAGRGFIAGGRIYWPLREGLRVLNLETGDVAPDDDYWRHRLAGVFGNAAFGNGCLAIADATRVCIFVPERRGAR